MGGWGGQHVKQCLVNILLFIRIHKPHKAHKKGAESMTREHREETQWSNTLACLVNGQQCLPSVFISILFKSMSLHKPTLGRDLIIFDKKKESLELDNPLPKAA